MKHLNNYITEALVKKHIITKDFIDLGLPSGTLWAASNLGAKDIYDAGDFYAWSETKAKENFGYTNYKFSSYDGYGFIKYNNNDKKIILDPEDDAATANDPTTHMPSGDQFEELVKFTNAKVINDENGSYVLLQSLCNDAELIFPLGGTVNTKSNTPDDSGFESMLWSNTSHSPEYADNMFIISNSSHYKLLNPRYNNSKYLGRNIRAVK